MTDAEQVLRKILAEGDGYQGYVDLEDGVIDVRVNFTAEEIAYLRTLMVKWAT